MSLKENDVYFENLRKELVIAIQEKDVQREMEIRQELKDANFIDADELEEYENNYN